MTEKVKLLFCKEPPVWGYRGDFVLWHAFQSYFEEHGLPETIDQFHEALEREYEHQVGAPLSSDKPSYVKKFAENAHGMSRGVILPRFWREDGIPRLLRRSRFLEQLELFGGV